MRDFRLETMALAPSGCGSDTSGDFRGLVLHAGVILCGSNGGIYAAGNKGVGGIKS